MVRSKEINEQMRAESRARILAAARQVFAEHGFFNCKVSDVAREAGMSQGNVYWYFPSKEDVLKAVLSDGFEALEAIMVAAQAYPGSALEKLDYLIDRFIQISGDLSHFNTIFLSLLGHGGAPFLQDLGFDTAQIGARYHQHLSTILAPAREQGIVADLDPNLHAMFFFSFFNGLLITYSPDWEELAPPEFIHAAVLRLLGVQPAGPVEMESTR